MVNYTVRVWNKDRTECKEKKLSSCQEVIDFLGITKHAYYNYMLGRTKMNASKTEHLKNIEVIKETETKTTQQVKPKTYYQKKHNPDKKLQDIYDKI